MNGVVVTDSDLADLADLPGTDDEPFLGFPSLGEGEFSSTGDTIDEGIPSPIHEDIATAIERPRVRGRHSASEDKPDEPREAKSGPPSLDEWSKFLSRVVLRTACDWYINWAFRGIDENAISDREADRLALTDDEKKLISVPFAELANKSKFMRKHGRTIVASGDAFNAVVVLGAWMSRVNRIAGRHRPRKNQHGKVTLNGNGGPGTTPANEPQYYSGANGGRVPYGNGVIPGSG